MSPSTPLGEDLRRFDEQCAQNLSTLVDRAARRARQGKDPSTNEIIDIELDVNSASLYRVSPQCDKWRYRRDTKIILPTLGSTGYSSASGKMQYFGVNWHYTADTDAMAVYAKQGITHNVFIMEKLGPWGHFVPELVDSAVVEIPVVSYCKSTLYYSMQSTGTGLYYDFGSKDFRPADELQVARARLHGPYVIDIPEDAFEDQELFLYKAAFGRSAKLLGNYIIVIRDSDNPDVVLQTIAFSANGEKLLKKATGYKSSTPLEVGLPPLQAHADHIPARNPRAID